MHAICPLTLGVVLSLSPNNGAREEGFGTPVHGLALSLKVSSDKVRINDATKKKGWIELTCTFKNVGKRPLKLGTLTVEHFLWLRLDSGRGKWAFSMHKEMDPPTVLTLKPGERWIHRTKAYGIAISGKQWQSADPKPGRYLVRAFLEFRWKKGPLKRDDWRGRVFSNVGVLTVLPPDRKPKE